VPQSGEDDVTGSSANTSYPAAGNVAPNRLDVDRDVRGYIVRELRALLRAAQIPGPYVLAGHSFGGMVARLYATTHSRRVTGLVSIDTQNEDFAAAYKDLLTLRPRPRG
jgi:pimeloyl-ACP methyl ester carboxylesterase